MEESGRSENGVSFLTYFRFPSSHTTVRAVRHTAVSYLSCPFWTPHIGHRHFFSIVGIRPIVLKREFLFGHLTTTVFKLLLSDKTFLSRAEKSELASIAGISPLGLLCFYHKTNNHGQK